MPRPRELSDARHVGRETVVTVGSRSKFFALILAIAPALGAVPTFAQTPTIAEVAAYQGPDRTQRLIAGAKKEKAVMVYGSTVAEDMRPVSDAFRKKYGIDFQYWRASSEQLVQRAVNEHRAGRCAVDAFATVAAELETLHREKLLIAVKTPAAADLAPLAHRPHGEWVATRLNIFSASFNTNLVKREEAPRKYEDLLRSALEGPSCRRGGGFRLVRHHRDEDGRGEGPASCSARSSRPTACRCAAATRCLRIWSKRAKCRSRSRSTATSRSSRSATARRSSRSISSPVVALGYGPAVSRCAPHPHAALLFHDFMIREGQEIMAKRNMTPTNPKIRPLPAGVDLTMIDPVEMLDNRQEVGRALDQYRAEAEVSLVKGALGREARRGSLAPRQRGEGQTLSRWLALTRLASRAASPTQAGAGSSPPLPQRLLQPASSYPLYPLKSVS